MLTERSMWIFNRGAVTPDLPGGTRHFDIGQELVKRGFDVTVFASGLYYGRYIFDNIVLKKRYCIRVIDGVRFVFVRTFQYERNNWKRVLNWFSFMLSSYRVALNLYTTSTSIPKPEVIIGSSVDLFAVLSAYFVAKRLNSRLFMEVRDLWPQTLIDMGGLKEKSPITKILQALEKFLYRKSEKIIVVPPFAGKYIASCGIDPQKTVWIPNGLDLTKYSSVKPSSFTGKNPFILMYTGAHGKANGLYTILEAARILDKAHSADIKFVFIGEGAEKKGLMKLASEFKLNNVEFRNPVPKKKVPKTLEEASALIFTLNDYDVFKYGISSNKLFDYMASGRPVIYCVKSANNPVAEADCGITVPSKDPKSLVKAILELYHLDIYEREMMGARAQDYVQKNHAMPILATKLINCI